MKTGDSREGDGRCLECGTVLITEDSPFSGACCLQCFSNEMEAVVRSQLPVTERNVAALFPKLTDVRLLRRGGMSKIYGARMRDTQECVALKVMDTSGNQQAMRDRLVEEMQALMSLDHPNILKIHEGGVTQGGDGYLITELVEGETLLEAMHAGPLAEQEVIRIGVDLTHALGYVHSQGMVHADVTPGNIMVTPNGKVLLLDFGLVYHMETSAERPAMGTPNYASPEQRRGEKLDRRADVYGLGVLLHVLLTGDIPPSSGDTQSTWDEITKHALAESPQHRFADMQHFRAALRVQGT